MPSRNRRGSHGQYGTTRRSSARKRENWSSSVVGTHASGNAPRQRQQRRTAYPHVSAAPNARRTAEVNQIHFQSRSVDERQQARHKVGQSRTASIMRKRDNQSRVMLVVGIILVIAIAFGLGTCAYRNSLSSSMALNDNAVSSQLVSANTQGTTYTLIAGITGSGSNERASYLAVLRVDAESNTASLLNIPSNIKVSYSNVSDDSNMLRDAPHAKDEGELVKQVSSLIGQDINHYVRVTDKGFISIVDALGGLNVNVSQYVDDPTVGTSVLDPGQQTLAGKQALAYVSAKNYNTGFAQRATVQNEVFQEFISAVKAKGGASFVTSADSIANNIKTDLSYDDITKLANALEKANLQVGTVPGSQSTNGSKVYWSVSSTSASQIYEQFRNGSDMDVSVDTSGIDRSQYQVIVLNGAGADGYSAQAASVLQNAGFSIKETGNAESFVYDETLVIYRTAEDKAAAEAAVKDLGVGRTVSAGVYYSLTTNIQVVVGKDWTAHA